MSQLEQNSNLSLKTAAAVCPLSLKPTVKIDEKPVKILLVKGQEPEGHGFTAIDEEPTGGEFKWELQPPDFLDFDGPSTGRTITVIAKKPGPTALTVKYEKDERIASKSVLVSVEAVPKLGFPQDPKEFKSEVDMESKAEVFELTNVGLGELFIKEVDLQSTTDFKIDTRNIRSSKALKEGESVTFEVRFTPKSLGDKQTNILVFSNVSDTATEIPIKGVPLNLARPTIEVVWGDNKPLSGVRVKIGDVDFGTTAYNGQVKFPAKTPGLEPGRSYQVDLEEFDTNNYRREENPAPLRFETSSNPYKVSLIKLAKPEIKVVWGKTQYWDGNDVSGVPVSLKDEKGTSKPFGVTNDSGKVEVPWRGKGIEPGTYEIVLDLAQHKEYSKKDEQSYVKLEQGSETRTTVELVKGARPIIEVLAGGPGGGNRLNKIGVKLRKNAQDPGYDFGETANGLAAWPKAEAAIPPGQYEVVLTYPPKGTQGESEPATVTLDPGFERTKTLRLTKLVRPTIQVVWMGAIRTALDKVGVKLRGPDGKEHDFGETAQSGLAELPKDKSLKPGTYQVLLSKFDETSYIPQQKDLTKTFEAGYEGIETIELLKVSKPKIKFVCGDETLEIKGKLTKTGVSNLEFDTDGVVKFPSNFAGVPPGTYKVEPELDGRFYALEDKQSSLEIRSGFDETKPVSLTKLLRPEIKAVWGTSAKPAPGVGIKLNKDGTEYDFRTTGDTGVAKLADDAKGLLPGDYDVELTLDPKFYTKKKKEKLTLKLNPNDLSKNVEVVKLARPQIRVVCEGKDVKDALVKLRKDTNTVDFGKTDGNDALKFPADTLGLAKDDYDILFTSDVYALTKHPAVLSLEEGEEDIKTLDVEPVNVVTPKIEMEYKVVMLDRDLAKHQEGSEVKIYAEPTYIEVSFTQTNDKHPYQNGAKFKCEPENVKVFVDEDCKSALTGDLTKQQLSTGKMKLYLRGKTAGKFKASLTLKEPAIKSPEDRFVKPATDPLEVDMSVVRLEMELYRNDATELAKIQVDPDTDDIATYHTALKNQALSPQKAMTDKEKVETGRLLHVQKSGNAGRAKLLCKLVDAQWPADNDTDAYEVVINETNTHGAVEVYDAEVAGNAQAFPIKLKVADLRKKDKELWVQGKTVTTDWREVLLDLGVDRKDGGLPKKPKRNGDWARFTVVEITKVKVDHPAKGGKDPWDEANKRFYINLDKNPDGRKVTLGAQLDPKLRDVNVHFMLAPDKNNGKTANWNIDFPTTCKWKDVPEAIKHLDKKKWKDLMHVSAKTDANGYAKAEVTLSRIGGDKFQPAAYVDEDPHLAKYVDGHTDLEKRKPVLCTETITVWRKVWYQVTRPTATSWPNAKGFLDSQRLVFIEAIVVGSEKEMKKTDFTEDPFRPQWQFDATNASTTAKLCIGTHNVDDAMKLFTPGTATTSPKFHVILCDEQFDAIDSNTKASLLTNVDTLVFGEAGPTATAEFELTSTVIPDHKLTILDPPLQGGNLVVSATWAAIEETAPTVWTPTHNGTLPAGNVKVKNGRGSRRTVEVTPPDKCKGGGGGCICGGAVTNLVLDATHAVGIQLQVQAANGPWAGWAPTGSVANVVQKNADDFVVHDVMGHEMGHLFGKVRSTNVTGLPDHPKLYQQRGGSGTHCANNAGWTDDLTVAPLDPLVPGQLDAQGKAAGRWDNGDCILFGIAGSAKREWCAHCAFEWLVSDLSKFG